jgi:hypothetical protein
MNTHPVDFKVKAFTARGQAFFALIVLALTACSSSVPASQSPETTPDSAIHPQAGNHAPIILQVVDRQESNDGFLYVYQDIYFNDPDGDAIAVTYQEISSSLPYPMQLTDDPIEASAEEQIGTVLSTVGGKCAQKMKLVFESRIRDRAGNLSEPVTFYISCTTPPVVDVQSILLSGLGIAASIALILLLGFWLLFRKHSGERLLALRSMLLFFCLLLWLTFMQRLLHEGGHALYTLIRGAPSLLFVHPFNFPGYSRPILDASVWKDISGSVSALSFSLIISLPFWKRRSLALLPLVVICPYVLYSNGMYIFSREGDFRNLMQTTGLPAIVLIITKKIESSKIPPRK